MTKPSPDPNAWLTGLLDAQASLLQTLGIDPVGGPAAQTSPTQQWPTAAEKLNAMQQDYLKHLAGLWQGLAPDGGQPVADRRFADPAWSSDPRFASVARGYLASSKVVRDAIDAAPLDERAKGQWSFAARQLVDALSPANFLATNPEAQQVMLETGGKSLIDGMNLLVTDMVKGRITMSDETAFKHGRNIATTEGSVIFENELIQLIRYKPLAVKVHSRPLLIVPPCINKFYILDLQPENSFVRYALEQGHMVYLLSWRSATSPMAHLGWDDYVKTGVHRAIEVALDASGADRINALGFCIGGTLLASAVAVLKATGKNPVASLTLLTTMLDFSDTGELGLLVSEHTVAKKEAEIGKKGLMRGADLAVTFSSLRANDLIWPYIVNSYLKGKAPPAFDLLFWNSDATNLPGPMYCWYVRNTYLENKLANPGQTVQCGVPVDLSSLDMPAYIYASREDHIVPWKTAYASHRVLGGPTTFVLGASGHIAGVINPASKQKRNHWVGEKVVDDAERWLAGAEEVPGSWWPHWGAWLARHAGPKAVAPKSHAKGKYPTIEPAPGRYVAEKAE